MILASFARGSLKPLFGEYGAIAYARFDRAECAVVCCNNREEEAHLHVDLKPMGEEDGTTFQVLFYTGRDGFAHEGSGSVSVQGGMPDLVLQPQSTLILGRRYSSQEWNMLRND